MDKKYLLVIAAALALVILAASAHAQSVSAVFNGPQNMDAGLQNGLNNLTGSVTFLPPNTKMLEDSEFYCAARCLPIGAIVTDLEVWP
jgi:hypothetical protein